MDETLNKLGSRQIFIYGEGPRGRLMLEYMEQHGVLPKAFIVSDGYKRDDIVVSPKGRSIPIIEFGEMQHKYPNTSNITVLLTINQRGAKTIHNDIAVYLRSSGGGDLIDLLEDQYYSLQFDTLRSYLSKFGVDLSSDVLKFKEMKMANPISVNKEFLMAMFTQIMNHIMPSIYDDYTYADQGPSQHDHVRIRRGDVVIDAGANLGIFSCFAAAQNCQVFAFEPAREAVETLKKQQAIYPDLINVMHMGLSDRDCTMEMHASSYIESGSTAKEPNGASTIEKYDVQVKSIDSLVADGTISKVDFLKLDTIGAEKEILLGAASAIKNFCPRIASRTIYHEGDLDAQIRIISSIEPRYNFAHTDNKLFAWVEQ